MEREKALSLWRYLALGALVYCFGVAVIGLSHGAGLNGLVQVSPFPSILDYGVTVKSLLILSALGTILAHRGLWRYALTVPLIGGMAYDAEWTFVWTISGAKPEMTFVRLLPIAWATATGLGFILFRGRFRLRGLAWFAIFGLWVFVSQFFSVGPEWGILLGAIVQSLFLVGMCDFVGLSFGPKVPA